jgi:predicted RNase H-like HicB family nuclease
MLDETNTGADTDVAMAYSIKIELEMEDDGRWIAEMPDLPGVMAYGATQKEALLAAEALALRVLADSPMRSLSFNFACA